MGLLNEYYHPLFTSECRKYVLVNQVYQKRTVYKVVSVL